MFVFYHIYFVVENLVSLEELDLDYGFGSVRFGASFLFSRMLIGNKMLFGSHIGLLQNMCKQFELFDYCYINLN